MGTTTNHKSQKHKIDEKNLEKTKQPARGSKSPGTNLKDRKIEKQAQTPDKKMRKLRKARQYLKT